MEKKLLKLGLGGRWSVESPPRPKSDQAKAGRDPAMRGGTKEKLCSLLRRPVQPTSGSEIAKVPLVQIVFRSPEGANERIQGVHWTEKNDDGKSAGGCRGAVLTISGRPPCRVR